MLPTAGSCEDQREGSFSVEVEMHLLSAKMRAAKMQPLRLARQLLELLLDPGAARRPSHLERLQPEARRPRRLRHPLGFHAGLCRLAPGTDSGRQSLRATAYRGGAHFYRGRRRGERKEAQRGRRGRVSIGFGEAAGQIRPAGNR